LFETGVDEMTIRRYADCMKAALFGKNGDIHDKFRQGINRVIPSPPAAFAQGRLLRRRLSLRFFNL
jgi:hypothetical protein